VVLSLLLLAPGAALATEPPRSLHLLEDLAEPASVEGTSSTAMRKVTVLGAALATSAAAGLGGFALAKAGCREPDPETESGGGCGYTMYPSLALGTLVGAPLGAWWGGTLMGGQGTFGRALAGAAIAGSLGVIVSAGFGDSAGPAALVALPLTTALGAMIGYEVSHSRNTASAQAAAPAFQPLVAVSSRSTALGLGGQF
jgi:hypothetical protein